MGLAASTVEYPNPMHRASMCAYHWMPILFKALSSDYRAFIGPTLGGLGVETIGFPYTTTIIAGINTIFVYFLIYF